MKAVTLEEVAKEAGVSKMTASRVLRNLAYVTPAKRHQVRRAAQKLGYRPNPMVQTLMSEVRRRQVQTKAVIAWVNTHPSGYDDRPSIPILEEGAAARARQLGFELQSFALATEVLSARRVRNILRARGVWGAVIAPLYRLDRPVEFPWEDFPVATIGRSIHEPHLHHSQANYLLQTHRALHQLTGRGFNRLAYCPLHHMVRRNDAAVVSVFEHYLGQQPRSRRIPIAWTQKWPAERFREWLKFHRPDAVLFDLPDQLQQLESAGFRFPEDLNAVLLSVPENDNRYAGIRHPYREIGAAAVDLVTAQLHRNERGIPEHPKCVMVEGRWMEGLSLRAVKS